MANEGRFEQIEEKNDPKDIKIKNVDAKRAIALMGEAKKLVLDIERLNRDIKTLVKTLDDENDTEGLRKLAILSNKILDFVSNEGRNQQQLDAITQIADSIRPGWGEQILQFFYIHCPKIAAAFFGEELPDRILEKQEVYESYTKFAVTFFGSQRQRNIQKETAALDPVISSAHAGDGKNEVADVKAITPYIDHTIERGYLEGWEGKAGPKDLVQRLDPGIL